MTKQNFSISKLITTKETVDEFTARITSIVSEEPTPTSFFVLFGIGALLLTAFLTLVGVLLLKGVGVWGIQIPVAWGFAITNFVWWIGIGHAGTLISAILLLLDQNWRNSVSRIAESMTLFAIFCAALFPLLHLGRPWLFYWLFPYPNTMNIQPQFRSALTLDMIAVMTYGVVSLLFWYLSLIPDLATFRDRVRPLWLKKIYAVFCLGWQGSSFQWHAFKKSTKILAGLATPLVISVHSIVSFDFAETIVKGWHNTLFPPFFVCGAILSGLAMVLTLVLPLRKIFKLDGVITQTHLNYISYLIITMAVMIGYSYSSEVYFAFFSNNSQEIKVITDRVTGHYAPLYLTMILCNVIIPFTLFFRKIREKFLPLFIASVIINIGMWLERYVIIVQSLSQPFLKPQSKIFVPTQWDLISIFGSIGIFLILFLIFLRTLPMISMFEIRMLLRKNNAMEKKNNG